MSNQYYDPNGGTGPTQMDPAPYGAPSGPSMKFYYPGGAPDPRYRPRPPPQQQPPPLSGMEQFVPLHDRSASVGAASEQWPLPALAIAQDSPRSNSASGNNPRRPPQRPPRADYQDAFFDQPRQHARMAAAYGPHSRAPPSQRPHYGNGEWTGDAYMASQPPFSPSSGYPRRPPPPRLAQSPLPDLPNSPQAMYYQQRNERPPQGPLPHSRRVPPVIHHGLVPPPIAEEAGKMRAGSQPGDLPENNDSLSPFKPGYAGHVKIPSYYFEKRGNSPIPESTSISGHDYHDSPMEPQHDSNGDESESDQRHDASPEPPVLIRQASLGKKTRPTLTTIKTGERRRGSSGESASTVSSRQQDVPSSKEQLTPFEEEVAKLPGSWISETPTPLDESSKDRALEAGGAADEDATAGADVVPAESKNSADNVSTQRRSSEILDPETHVRTVSPIEQTSEVREDATEVETAVSPVMTQMQLPTPRSPVTPSTQDNSLNPRSEQQQSSQPRSPLTPSSQDGILNRRGLTPTDNTVLKSPSEEFSADSEKHKLRDLTIDIAAIREAEARGSMTSLPDLIKRATRLASNLDRGKTASRVGLNFFDFNSSAEAVERLRAAEDKNRRSASLSDMLTAFPAPGSKDEVRRSRGNFSTMLRRSQLPSESDVGAILEKQERKYCGLPLKLFWLLLAVLFLLIAAAIIIPVVLVVVPKDSKDTANTAPPSNPALARCEQQLICQNGGLNIIGSGSSCSCLCINGYTGNTCTTHSQTGCTTMSAGSTKNATVGEDIPRLLSGSAANFSIPLDGVTLLGLFSKTDLTCTSENALVTFSNAPDQSASIVDRTLLERPSNIDRRQLRKSPTLPSSSPSSQSGSSDSSGSVIDFARVAVLYIFQQTTKLDSAATAQENFQSYFSSRQTSAGTQVNPKNITLGNGFSCDLFKQSLVWTLSNGTTVAS